MNTFIKFGIGLLLVLTPFSLYAGTVQTIYVDTAEFTKQGCIEQTIEDCISAVCVSANKNASCRNQCKQDAENKCEAISKTY